MLIDEEKLYWWGLDMRPRARRRLMVVCTYVALVTFSIAPSEYEGHPVWAMVGLFVGIQLLVWLSVMRRNGIVKRFEPKPPPMQISGMGEVVWVEGLDQWARYFYDVASFETASPEQQDELLSRFKAGKRLFPAKRMETDAPWLDERELKERESAERWSARQVMWLLSSFCGVYTSRAMSQRPIHALDVAIGFLMCCVALQTLPSARVLWTEADPRDMLGGLAIVEHGES